MHRSKRAEIKELISERLRVIKPMCEEALGRHIDGEITVRVHGRLASTFLVNVWYPIKKAFTSQEGSISDDWFSRALTVAFAPLLFVARGICSMFGSEFRARAGYAVTGENIIVVISSSQVLSKEKELDYFLAHELTHLLTADVEQIPKAFGHMVYEGVATYYGEMVTRRLHPGLMFLIVQRTGIFMLADIGLCVQLQKELSWIH
jgi:ABC-type multidrug transport system fused ATPase/permease subunit